jgi:hypothetical protein
MTKEHKHLIFEQRESQTINSCIYLITARFWELFSKFLPDALRIYKLRKEFPKPGSNEVNTAIDGLTLSLFKN